MGRTVAASPPADMGDAPVMDARMDAPPAGAPQQQPGGAAGAAEAAARLQRLALGGLKEAAHDAASTPAAHDSPRGGSSSPRAAVVQIGFDAPPLRSGGDGAASSRERGATGSAAARSDAAAQSALHRTLSRDSLLREELSGGGSPRSGSSVGSVGSLAGSPLRPPAGEPPAPMPASPRQRAGGPAASARRAATEATRTLVGPPPRAPGPRGAAAGVGGASHPWAPPPPATVSPAVSVPQRSASASSASTEAVSPPPSMSPSPLSPLWLRSPGAGGSASGGGSFGTRPGPPQRANSGGASSGRTLLGSFEQSLMSGRALWGRGAPPQRLPGFTAVLCVRAVGEPSARAPSKRRLPFAAECFAGAPGCAAPPYCASIALDGGGGRGAGAGGAGGERIRVPLRGELVLVLSNPEATPLHTFRVPYDLGAALGAADSEPGHAATRAAAPAAKAYVRQRVFAVPRGGPPHAVGTLRYALQLRFVAPAARPARAASERRGAAGDDESDPAAAPTDGDGEAPTAAAAPRRKLYLQGDLRVVFPPRRPDEDAETLRVQQDPPLLEAAREHGAAYSESL